MDALRYMEKQIAKHNKNLENAMERHGVTEAELNNIRDKISYYECGVAALRKETASTH